MPDWIDNTHPIEGVVLRVEHKDGFSFYKEKSFAFKVMEGIMKDAGVLDEEEAQSAERHEAE